MFLNLSRVIVHGEKVLELSRVVELGVRGVVYLHVARLHLSRFFRLRGIARDWKDSYPVVLAVKDRAKTSVSTNAINHLIDGVYGKPARGRSPDMAMGV